MLIDSIELVQGGTFNNLTIASGASFPVVPDLGELFFKELEGLHVFNGTTWELVATEDAIAASVQTKADITYVDSQIAAVSSGGGTTDISGKADITYVDSQLATKMPIGKVPYDIATSYPGKPAASATVLSLVVARAFTIGASWESCQAKSGSGSSGTSTFTIKKNGASIGTFSFGSGSSTATFSVSPSYDFVAGDIIVITSPSSVDNTLADVSIILAGKTEIVA